MSSSIHLYQLRQQNPRRSTPKQQYPTSNLNLHPLDTMRRAGTRFDKHCLKSGKIADRMHQSRRVATVLRETAGDVAAECRHVGA
jgi:hypothetical protein